MADNFVKLMKMALRQPRAMRMTMTPKMVRARALALEHMEKWGLRSPVWTFRFNNRKRGMGLCSYPRPLAGTPGRIELSRHMVERNEEAEVLDTILHEIAHALAGETTGHGPAWQAMCLKVGARPQRCGHNADMPKGRWQARCGHCGKVYNRHRKPKYSSGYYCPPCGNVQGTLQFVLTTG